MDPAERFVSHILSTTLDRVPADAVERAKISVLDTIATSIGGSGDEALRRVRAYAGAIGGVPECSVLVFGERLPATSAAFVNAVMSRVLDFDETYEAAPSGCHASAYIVPGALALAERDPSITGAEFLTAVIVAMDVHMRLARSITANAIDTGRDNMVAVFGTTAAAVRLLRLDHGEGLDAYGIAYAEAAGEFQMHEEVSDTVALQQGFRCRSGLEAALLARAGLRGPHQVFSGKYGFFKAFEPEHDLDALLDGLGRDYLNAYLSFKPFPCCKCTHPSITALLALREAEGFGPDDVEAIRVATNRLTLNLVAEPRATRWRPRDAVTARFSMPYAVAVAAARGRVGIEDFKPPAFDDPVLHRLMDATTCEVDPEIEESHRTVTNAPSVVTVRLKGGAERSLRVDYAYGNPNNPVRFESAEEKLRQCAEVAARPFDADRLGAIGAFVRDLDSASDLGPLFELLVPGGSGEARAAE